MTGQVLLFAAAMSPTDISVARREPDGTLRRAEYANVNWLNRFTQDSPAIVSLLPSTDLALLNDHLQSMLGVTYTPVGSCDVTHQAAGYFRAMKRYHGSNWDLEIADAPIDLKQISEAIGVPVAAYEPDKNSVTRLNWTMRLWDRVKD